MDGIEVLGVPVIDFDPYCLKHGAERRALFKLATLEDAGLKSSALLKYFSPKKPSEKQGFTHFAPIWVNVYSSACSTPDRYVAPSLLFLVSQKADVL